ncbi:NAD(P)H-dependent glycerol-3-phosphate dehydrogenase [Malacoplasma muris]|uniref:NAD(P)H-dependent glycerol-3-phosphate dehydrogenase n=1 Tax=Malacoplasma muris TaxID=2119 RepID=UPI00398EEB11
MNNKIAILGTGAWGTALSCCLSNNGYEVEMWGINPSEIKDLNSGYNRKFFGNKKLFAKVKANIDLQEVIENAKYILLAIPSTFIIEVLDKVKPFMNNKNKYIIINVAKGLDPITNNVWSKSIYKNLKKYNIDLATLIGPSFAIDVFEKKPTVVNVVSKKLDVAKDVAQLFNSDFFKAVPCKDEIGSQILASLKNLLAIAIGISEENHNSINTISALLTQGVNEMQLIAKHMGAKDKTILQFCGIGDIFLTCTSNKSRNFTFGKQIFKNGLDKVLKENKATVEGYKVYPIVKKIINQKKLDVPVFKLIIKVLDKKLEPSKFVDTALDDLMWTEINNPKDSQKNK